MLVSLIALVVLVCLAYFLGGYPIGFFQASYDLAFGTPKVLAYGLRSAQSDSLYAHILKSEYRIDFSPKGCVVTPYDISYADAYNATIAWAMKKKYGRDIFQDIHERVQKAHRDKKLYQQEIETPSTNKKKHKI